MNSVATLVKVPTLTDAVSVSRCINRPTVVPISTEKKPSKLTLTSILFVFSAFVCSFTPMVFATTNQPLALPVLSDNISGTTLEEYKIGEKIKHQIYNYAPLNTDPLIKSYLELLVYKLASSSQLQFSDRKLSVFLIEDPTINAFAAPGGIIGINLGLFLHAQNEHEFSSVLAHEFAHLSQKHYARGAEKSKRMLLPFLASIIGGALLATQVGVDSGFAVLATTNAAFKANRLSYSRSIEREADRVGLETLIRAGMNPQAMASMFQHMNRATRFNQKIPEFLLTHPITESRISDARGQASRYSQKKSYNYSSDYDLIRSRVQLIYDQPENTYKKYLAVQKGNADKSEKDLYYLALELSKSLFHAEAISIIEQLCKADPQRTIYLLTKAEIYIASNNPTKTTQILPILKEYTNLNPENLSAAILYAKALAKANLYSEAKLVVAKQVRLRPNDIDLLKLQATVSGQSNDIVSVHRTRAKIFKMQGEYKKALQQLKYAEFNVKEKNDRRMTAIIDHSIAEIKKIIDS